MVAGVVAVRSVRARRASFALNFKGSGGKMQGIVILGMYHSGTTYLARLLHDRGIPMHGGQGYFEGEVTGLHYEDAEVVEKNRLEVKRLQIKDGIATYSPSTAFMKWLRGYKRRRESCGELWGVKEPRMAVFSKAYLDVFRNCKIILCHRCPGRVAQTRHRKYLNEGQNPMNLMSAYEHTHAGVLDNYRKLNLQGNLFAFWYDGTREWHERQNETLNKFLEMDFNYINDWKFDT